MIYISFVVPSYNSEDYLERCVDTLMPDSTDVEIIIVNDGSKDRTAEIADRYREKYPDTVRVVHKENGGHGSAVNKGLELAKGQYLKVVDSDEKSKGKGPFPLFCPLFWPLRKQAKALNSV